jgi:biopolymer transport protein ExbD
MSDGNRGSMTSEINVTPMIDVLLVLLIIFMVIVPALPRGEAVLAPKAALQTPTQPEESVVLEVLKGTAGDVSFRINQHEVGRKDLAARLSAIYANRAQRVLFVMGDDKVSFSEVAQVIDLGHSVGVDHIGLMTPKIMAGQ